VPVPRTPSRQREPPPYRSADAGLVDVAGLIDGIAARLQPGSHRRRRKRRRAGGATRVERLADVPKGGLPAQTEIDLQS
jgi:hypothetical protein